MFKTNFGVSFKSPLGVGDKIATIYSMENCGRQTGEKFKVCGFPLVTKAICDLFDLNYVIYTDDDFQTIESTLVRSKLSTMEYSKRGYVHYISRIKEYLQEKHGYNPLESQPLIPKKHKRIVGDYVVSQLDSRFAGRHGFRLNKKNMLNLLKKHCEGERIVIIGGEETTRYLGYSSSWLGSKFDYKLGNLDFLLKTIQHSNRFVGVDSGMSHLAAAVGIPSTVYFLVPKWYARAGLNREDGQNIPDDQILDAPTNWSNSRSASTDLNPSLLNYYLSYQNVECFGRNNLQFDHQLRDQSGENVLI